MNDSAIQNLNADEVESVAGGPFFVPFLVGALAGGGAAALILAIEDAVGYHDHY